MELIRIDSSMSEPSSPQDLDVECFLVYFAFFAHLCIFYVCSLLALNARLVCRGHNAHYIIRVDDVSNAEQPSLGKLGARQLPLWAL